MFNKKYIIGFLLIICVMATFCGCTSYREQLKEQNPPENYKRCARKPTVLIMG